MAKINTDQQKTIPAEIHKVIYRNLLYLNSEDPQTFLQQLRELREKCSDESEQIEGYSNRSVQNLKQKLGFSEDKINDLMNTTPEKGQVNEVNKAVSKNSKKDFEIGM